MSCRRIAVVVACVAICPESAALAQDESHPHDHPEVAVQRAPVLIEPGPLEATTLYHTADEVMVTTETRFRFICGSDVANLTVDDLHTAVETHRQIMEDTDQVISVGADASLRGAGLNVIFNIGGGVPNDAIIALEEVSAFYQTAFTDPVNVTIDFSMQNLGGGILGATGSSFTLNTWSTTRSGLINGMDSDDSIQNSLPGPTTIPVRYDASTTNVTNENRCFFTRANHKATIGSLSGTDASMALNSTVNWDFDPSDGVPGNAQDFQSVVVHEVGHALGFVSEVDSGGSDIDAMDIFRFTRTDDGDDFNPDSLAEFETTPRTVDFNNPDDDHNTDLITVEYRMADGSPSQASHFRSEFPPIGIMDPSQANGETFFPDFLQQSDIDVFDAIGWDFVDGDCDENGLQDDDEIAANSALDCQPDGVLDVCQLNGNDCNGNLRPDQCDVNDLIAQQPVNTGVCQGETAVISVSVSGGGTTFRWERNGVPMFDGGGFSGVFTNTLTVTDVQPEDEDLYRCRITQGCLSGPSNNVNLFIIQPATVASDPTPMLTRCGGDNASFSVEGGGTGPFDYQWLLDGQDFGAPNSSLLTLNNVTVDDAGSYTCIISNSCGFEESAAGVLEIGDPVFFDTPQSQCVESGETVVFTADATADGAFSIFWEKDGAFISGESGNTLTIENVQPTDAGDYNAVAFLSSSPFCSSDSDIATLTVDNCGVNDCNSNGVDDATDIAGGTSDDCNSNLVPDECDVLTLGDFDADGDRDLDDYAALEDCLDGPVNPTAPAQPECSAMCLTAFDTDTDGVIDLRDYATFVVLFGT